MNPTRKIALVTGILFLITFITSIPAQLFLYHPLLSDPAKYMAGVGADPRVSLGALLEIILAIAGIGSAVVLYPVTKRQNRIVALGYVTSRVMESAAIMVGIFSLLAVVTLRHDYAGASGADTASLVFAARSFVALHDAAFLLGPTLLAGLGNGALLGYLMYRSGHAVSKAGEIQLVHVLALELGPHRITANIVSPGLTDISGLSRTVQHPEYQQAFITQVPIGRLGTPDEIANAVLFIASDQASFITGQLLCVDGGYSAGKLAVQGPSNPPPYNLVGMEKPL